MESKKNNSDKEDKLPTASSLTPQKKSVFSAPAPKIEGYHIISTLGEGGFGVVYLAEQQRPVKRRVALKVIKPGMDSKQVIARFEAEEQALALLDHPNIAGVYEAGMAENGHPYFAMEYVKGVRITEHCDREKLGIEERLKLFLQVCDAIGHAHQKGIIHRDIKPSNILVSIDGESVVPKVIDFGVAKAISQPLTEQTLFTEQGQLIGTPEYMSPEQAEMTAQDVDTRTDIYSLGVLLYELLTGALPFDPKMLREAAFAEIQRIIREQDPPRPSTRLSSLGEGAEKVAQSRRTEVVTLARRLHKELEWIPLKAMRKERSHRYRSASELADDIQNYLDGNPLIAGPESAMYRVKKFVRRNRALVTGIAAVLIVLAAGIVVSIIFAIGQARARAGAERQARISQSVGDFLTDDLLAWGWRFSDSSGDVSLSILLDVGASKLEGRFEGEPLIEASIREALGKTYLRLDEYEGAEPHLERAYQIRLEQLGEANPSTLASMNNLALLYRKQDRYDEAEALYVKTLNGRRRTLGEEHPDTLESMCYLASVCYYQGQYDKAKPLLVKALEIGRRVLGEDDIQNQISMGWLAKVYREQGHNEQAEPLYVEMLEFRRRVLGEDKGMVTEIVMKELIKLYETWGKPQQAKECRAKLQDLRTAVIFHFGDLDKWIQLMQAWKPRPKREEATEEPPPVVDHMGGLAEWYSEQGRYEEAEALYLERLEIQRQVLGAEHPDVLSSMEDLAGLYYQQRRYDEAERLIVKVLEISRRVLGEEHPDTLELMIGLARLRATCPVAQLRDGAEAVKNATKACELTNWKKPWYIDTLAAAHAEAGDFEAAMKWQRQAIDLLTDEQYPGWRLEFESRLKLYESGKPYRESL